MGTIWLIVEDENDKDVVQAILDARQIIFRVKPLFPSGGSGGISRLTQQLERLIKVAKAQRSQRDCIAVLHDLDALSQWDRTHYDHIEAICSREGIHHIVAKDELESWLLADSGLCQWLEINTKNWDNQSKPSVELNSFLQKKKIKYQGVYRRQVIRHLNGDGDKHSPSMRDALRHLENAPCLAN